MKKITKIIASVISGAIISLAVHAQENLLSSQGSPVDKQIYQVGIGARLGSGLTVKRFLNPSTALEGILSFGYNTLLVTGLYEKHLDITSARGLKWVFGLGGHVGFFRYLGYYYWVYDFGNRVFYERSRDATVAVAGTDFIVGLDYKFRRAPFNVSLDAKPFIDFYKGEYSYFDGALSVRFAF